MFGKKLFQEKIDPRCVYCAKGAPLDEGQILCAKRGVVSPEGSCAAFQYDPFKRVPPKPVKLDTSKLKDQDFRLD
jgi:hypothetical protein